MITNMEIEENLYAIYSDIIASGLVATGDAGSFSFITHPGYAWPDMIYSRRPSSELSNPVDMAPLARLCSSASCPRLVILGEARVTDEALGQLSELRFRPVTRWTNMAIDIGQPEMEPVQGQLKGAVIDADSPDEWRDWSSVVESVLFKGGKLDRSIFSYAAGEGLFKLLIGYFNDQPVTASLLYLGKSAGMYMVATLPGFQGRGFAAELMRLAQSAARSAGYGSIVLHSTQAGLDFYKRMGFREYGKLLLFYNML